MPSVGASVGGPHSHPLGQQREREKGRERVEQRERERERAEQRERERAEAGGGRCELRWGEARAAS